MNATIKIPYVPRDKRIGSVFNFLFEVINETEKCNEETVIWDFCETTFCHPFFLAPLAIYKSQCGKEIKCKNINSRIDRYFKLIKFHDILYLEEKKQLVNTLNPYINRTYIPICKFNSNSDNADGIQSIIQKIIETQSKATNKIKTPLAYMFSELICNINQHSESQFVYMFSQVNNKEKCINICISDKGITIYGSYIKAKKYIDKINNNEAMALKLANEGFSTKNLPHAENRGYGISTSRRMLVEGMGGEFFMLSGGAFHRHTSNKNDFVELPPNICWKGTIILLKIPTEINNKFNYIEYTK